MRHRSIWLRTAVLVVAAGGLAWYVVHQPAKSAAGLTRSAVVPAVPVTAGLAETKNIPVYLTGLGTVQAFNTVVVKVRVDGQLDKVAFTEGQDVKAGDLLAQIDQFRRRFGHTPGSHSGDHAEPGRISAAESASLAHDV
jgi:multidrug efflux system membrane fusion protein